MRFFALLLVVAAVGCQRATPTALEIDVDVAVAEVDRNEHILSFNVPPDVEIAVDAGGDKSSATIDKANADGTFTLKLAVSRKRSVTDGQSEFTTLVQTQSSYGLSVGGPSIYTEDSNLSLSDVLLVDLESGTYPLGEPINVGTIKGKPITLAVRPVNGKSGG